MLKYILFVFSINTFVITNCQQVNLGDMNCDFSKDTCKWQYKELHGKWSLNNQNTRSLQANGPLHGPISGQNSYFVQFFESTKNTQNGDLVTPIIKPTTTQTCFSFYYYAFSLVDNVSLALFSIQDTGIEQRNDIWFKANSHNDKWHRIFINIPPQNKPFTLDFIIFAGAGLLALSSFEIKQSSCDQSYSDFTTWDFEDKAMGSWILTYENPRYKWDFIQAKDSHFGNNKGQFDHSTMSMSGHMAEATSLVGTQAAPEGSRTILKNINLKAASYCLSFWVWRRSGKDILEIIQEIGQQQKTLWSINEYDSPLNEWYHATVTIDSQYTKSNISIVATKSSANDGLINVDDVKLIPNECPAPVTCNFNNDWCGWTYNYYADSRTYWELGDGRVIDSSQLKAKNLISDYDPNNIHGGLIYTDFTRNIKNENWKIDLFSDVIQDGTSSTGSCLEFSYLQRSENVDFAVYITLVKDSQRVKTVWHSKDFQYQNDQWKTIQNDVSYKEPFRFLFTLQSNSSSTYVLVDNIFYSNMPCDQVPNQNTTSKSAGSVVLGILIPLIVIALFAGGFVYYRKYKFNHLTNIIYKRHEGEEVMRDPVYDVKQSAVNIEETH